MNFTVTARIVSVFALTLLGSLHAAQETQEVANLRAIAVDIVRLTQDRLPLPGAVCTQPSTDGLSEICARLTGSSDEATLRAMRPQDIESAMNAFDAQALRSAKNALNADGVLSLMVLNFDHFLDIERYPDKGFGYFASKMTQLVTTPNGKVMPAYEGVYRALNGSGGSVWGSALSYCIPDHYSVGKKLETALTTLPEKVKVRLLAVVAPKGLDGEHRAAVRNRILSVLKYRLDIDKEEAAKNK